MKNMGTADRILRAAVVAVALVVVAIVVGVSSAVGIIALVVAAVMVLTAAVGFCPLYRLVGVSTCKLEPKADAQLHLVIADILQGVEAMEGKAKKMKRQAGALKVAGALEKYNSYFDHPGWQPLKH